MDNTPELIVGNIDDVEEFAKHLASCPVFKKLTEDEKLKIIYSYPFKVGCILSG